MNRLPIYLLLVSGLATLPVYVMNNGTPTITRKKAIKYTHNKISLYLLKKFWILHGLTVIVESCALIYLMEKWYDENVNVKIGLVVLLLVCVIFSAVMAAMPAYILTKHWKR